ncbi:MAG: hypothetical protein BWY82_02183 [Verrucomicrobia bacterium ADurb.Bin474]|nr:MAG: hypothetical protein BWY82_02183 [Verrucomicrobia bacterium ADurb.Bin474]
MQHSFHGFDTIRGTQPPACFALTRAERTHPPEGIPKGNLHRVHYGIMANNIPDHATLLRERFGIQLRGFSTCRSD